MDLYVLKVDKVKRLIDETADFVGIFKVGMSFYEKANELTSIIRDANGKTFLDLKFHDIPNTVANATRKSVSIGVSLFNIHCTGGLEMMKASKDAAMEETKRLKSSMPEIYGVTVLTSINKDVLDKQLKIRMGLRNYALYLAGLAKEAGLDGVVCSGHEAARIKNKLGKEFKTIVPGIRPLWMSDVQDQARVLTPKKAIKAGADIIVVGRPIIKAESPRKAAQMLHEEVEEAWTSQN